MNVFFDVFRCVFLNFDLIVAFSLLWTRSMDYMDEVLIFAATKILEFPWSLPIRSLNRLELYPGNEAFNVSLLLVVDLSLYFQTPVIDEKTGETKDKVTAFIVERGFGGVTRYYLKVT